MVVASFAAAYLVGLASWFLPLGIQMVLFPWLVAVVLQMNAFWVGVATFALMAPSLLFLPLGGLVADRGNPRRLLVFYHLAYAVPPIALAAVIGAGGLGYAVLLLYAIAAGAISAFATPTRDALLPTVATGSLPRAVALATALQFVGQLAGIALAWSADAVGAVPLLLAQAVLVLAGIAAVLRVPDPPPHPPRTQRGFWHEIADGVGEAGRSPAIWPVLLLSFGVGVFYVGPFMAILPLVIRDHYGGGSAELSWINLAFWTGTILASMAFAALFKGATRRGRMVAIAVTLGAIVLVCMSTLPPLWLFVALCFVWGLGAGVTMTQSHAVVQIEAPATHRARLMALFQLGLSGGGPIGAVLTGTIASIWGLQAALLVPAIAMAGLIGFTILRSSVWTMRTVEAPPA